VWETEGLSRRGKKKLPGSDIGESQPIATTMQLGQVGEDFRKKKNAPKEGYFG